MDQQPWTQQSRPQPAAAGGSVRRARERAEAGETPASQIPQPAQRGAAAAPPRNPVRMRPPMATALGSRNGQVPIGVAISRPIQAPQWPLAGTIEGGPDPRVNPQYQPPPNRGPAPKRPPRPSQVPPLPENQPNYRSAPGTRYDEEEDEDEDEDPFSPMTASSRPSTLSSVGSIPDFPAPVQAAGPGRRSANLGPPPTSRRGASSYYSQVTLPSFVSPIPEESPRPSHQSYASSAAIPTSWGSDSPREYEYDEADYEDEDLPEDPRDLRGPIEEGRGDSRGSNGDDSEDRGLIRSASFGRRAKPSMIMTRGADRTEATPRTGTTAPPVTNLSKLEKMGFGGAAAAAAAAATTTTMTTTTTAAAATGGLALPRMSAAQRDTIWPDMDRDDPLSNGTGLRDDSTSSEDASIARAITINEPAPTYTPNPSDPNTNAMLGAYNQASSLHPGPAPLRTPSPGFSRLSAIRRPPRLDMDAVRDAEARGSLTSLPDLIKRATKLAAMMDRGKRPGSRMALNDFGSETDLSREKEMGRKFGDDETPTVTNLTPVSPDEKHKSGLSGMLAAFPPPGVQTPRGTTPTRPTSTWPSGYDGASDSPRDLKAKKPRRCCGMPLWAFLLLVLLLLVAAAAAVVVPLEFLVFHKAKSTTSTSLTAVQQCEAATTTACQNGGTSLIDNGACACICTNGFTGSTCTSANATGCATTTLAGLTGNVTLGDAISRLIVGSKTNFSVPLDAKTIVARFNSNSLSCATENALVTFDGQSGRLGNANDVVKASATLTASIITSTAAAAKLLKEREQSSASSSSSMAVATGSGGIVFDPSNPSSTSTSTTAARASSTISSSAAQSSAVANPTGIFSITEEVLDFARVAVLYILQQGTTNGASPLDAAASAQTTLQHFFSLESFTNAAAMNVSLGNGAFADLVGFSVNLGNGTVGSRNASLTRRLAEPEVWGRGARLWETPL
jgi:hypothetical protein